MVLGLQLYGVLADGKKDVFEVLKALKAEGFDSVEFCVDLMGKGQKNGPFLDPETFLQAADYAKSIGLSVTSIHVHTDNLLKDADTLCGFAENPGIRHFVVSIKGERTAKALQEAAFKYRAAAEKLEKCGARILIHNSADDMAVKVGGRTAYEYFADICLGKVGMQLDTGWAEAGGVNLVEFFTKNEARIESLHFKDFADPSHPGKDTFIGNGAVDNKTALYFGRAKAIPLYADQDAYAEFPGDAVKSRDTLMQYGQMRDHVASYLNILDVETGEVTVLKEFDGVVEAPNWCADGKTLVYNADGCIFRYDIESGNTVKVDTGIATGCNNDHVLAADGTAIAVSSGAKVNGIGGSRVYIVPFDGSGARLITPESPSYLHGWSPDMKTLTYCAFRQVDGVQHVDVYTIPAEGGEEKRLTTAGFNDGPEYSPDGKHIWYISTRSGLMQVYRMNADGTEDRQMTYEEQNNWFGHVSPDGKRVVNISYGKGELQPNEHLPNMSVELWLMDYEGQNRRKLIRFFGGQGSINVNSWAPDSRHLAFVSYDSTF